MKIVTWNVNSLKAREEFFLQFVDKEAPDVLCLQELKQETHAVKREMFESRGYEVSVFGQKQWNGVLIASKSPITDVKAGLEGYDAGQSRIISATINNIRIINLYCPQGQSEESEKYKYKLKFYDGLIKRLGLEMKGNPNLVVTGDFNIAPEPCDVYWDTIEKPSVVTHHPLELQKWKEMIELGLVEVGRQFIPEGGFTFWDYRAFWDFQSRKFRYDKGMRIDHFVLSSHLVPYVENVEVYRGWRRNRGKIKASDHAPVFLELREESLD
jgi:exodeoxyribonuclease III